MLFTVPFKTVKYFYRSARIVKKTAADRNCRSACKYKFDCVLRSPYTAHPDDRQRRNLRYLIDHPDCNRFYRRAGQSAENIAKQRLLRIDVNCHTGNRVNQRQGIRALSLRDAGKNRNVGNVRRQLHDERFPACRPYQRDHPLRLRRIGTKSHPSVLYIRTGNIELYGRNFRNAVEPSSKFRIFFCGFTVNIHNQRNVQLRNNFRQYPPHKLIIADIF